MVKAALWSRTVIAALTGAVLLAAAPASGGPGAGADNAGRQAKSKLFKLRANFPNGSLKGQFDVPYRYLSDRAAKAYSAGRYVEAESLYRAALDDATRSHAADADVAVLLTNLASTYRDDGKYESARPLFKQAMQMTEKMDGAGSQLYSYALGQYAGFLSRTGDYEQARFAEESARGGFKLAARPIPLYWEPPAARNPFVPLVDVGGWRYPGMMISYTHPPLIDVTRETPVLSPGYPGPGSFRLHFAECPPKERWAAFDSEQRTLMKWKWDLWLAQVKEEFSRSAAAALETPVSGRYHLVFGRSGHIEDFDVLSDDINRAQALQSISGVISLFNNARTAPFPAETQMDQIHVIVDYQGPMQPQLPEEEALQKLPPITWPGFAGRYPARFPGQYFPRTQQRRSCR